MSKSKESGLGINDMLLNAAWQKSSSKVNTQILKNVALTVVAIAFNFGVYLFLKKKKGDVRQVDKYDLMIEEISQMTAASTNEEDDFFSVTCSPSLDPMTRVNKVERDYCFTDVTELK